MKFGRIKRQHGRLEGLDSLLDRIVKGCEHVSRIVPGRIKVRKGTNRNFKIQYPTEGGLKCLYTAPGTVQEVFLICSDQDAASRWLEANGLLT
jgi:hypothetical protein